jgi:cystathionine gamma-synthase
MSDETPQTYGNGTAAVHAGSQRRRPYAAITPPIVQSATYTFVDSAELIEFQSGRLEREEYGRYGNPTVRAVEARLAALESPTAPAAATLSASGMSAITTAMFALLPAGSHLILTDDGYRRTRQFARTLLGRLGVEHSVVAAGDLDALAAAIRPGVTRLIVIEVPTNPYLRVVDLAQLAEIARAQRVKTLVDATFATPFNLRPLEHGIDLVVHSATKYLAGHNDLLAGVTIGRPQLISALRDLQGIIGGISDAHTAYLIDRGLKTLALRMERQNASGLAVAQFLEAHPRVTRVHYPGLASHPDHAVAVRQMRGFGGVVSFEVAGELMDAAAIIDRLRIPYIAPSLGGVESLVEQPAIMSYYEMTSEERLAVGIRDTLIRYSCGVEDTDDLIADLAQALA